MPCDINELDEKSKIPAELLQLIVSVTRLRSPTDGCLWFRGQTLQTLRRYLLEEVYEVLDALDSESPEKLLEELGDLLFQVVVQTRLASERGWFSLLDVLYDLNKKIVRRNPHVFGERRADTTEEAQRIWREMKAAEKITRRDEIGLLDGLSTTMPALALAQAYLIRSGSVNAASSFSDPYLLSEIEAGLVADPEKMEINLGKVLFLLADLACRHHLDAEASLRQANAQFRQQVFERSGKSL